MTTLALDLGTKCGWCVRAADGQLHSGAWTLASKLYENRWLAFWDHLQGTHLAHDLDTIVYEKVRRHLGTDASHVYGGFEALLEMWVGSQRAQGLKKIYLTNWEVGTIKKCATGKGNAKKPAVVKAMKARFSDQYVQSEDQADALAILYTEECGGTPLLAQCRSK